MIDPASFPFDSGATFWAIDLPQARAIPASYCAGPGIPVCCAWDTPQPRPIHPVLLGKVRALSKEEFLTLVAEARTLAPSGVDAHSFVFSNGARFLDVAGRPVTLGAGDGVPYCAVWDDSSPRAFALDAARRAGVSLTPEAFIRLIDERHALCSERGAQFMFPFSEQATFWEEEGIPVSVDPWARAIPPVAAWDSNPPRPYRFRGAQRPLKRGEEFVWIVEVARNCVIQGADLHTFQFPTDATFFNVRGIPVARNVGPDWPVLSAWDTSLPRLIYAGAIPQEAWSLTQREFRKLVEIARRRRSFPALPKSPQVASACVLPLRPTEKASAKPYTVRVADNFHYMDESETYTQGHYATYEEAVAVCKRIVDEWLEGALRQGFQIEELYTTYVNFGDDPYVIPSDASKPDFSAWDYARERCVDWEREDDKPSGTR